MVFISVHFSEAMWAKAGRSLGRQIQCLLCRTSSTITASKSSEILPFSAIPKIPTIPFISTGWAYLPYIGKYQLSRMQRANLSKLKEYGPIVLEQFSPSFSVVLLYDAQEVAKVFRAEGRFPERSFLDSFRKYRESRKDLFTNSGLAGAEGQEWYEVRSQTQPHMMKPKAIHAYIGAMDEVVGDFIHRMVYLRGKDGGEVPGYLNELNKWALESVALVALDARLGCLNINPNQEAAQIIKTVIEIFQQILYLEFSSFQLWRLFTTPMLRKFFKNLDFLSDTVQKYLFEAKKRLENVPSDHEATFLEMMISTSKDPKNVNAILTDMFFAGVDTSSNTVGFTLYHLARNQEVQEKAYQEVKSLLKDGEVTSDVLNKARYLKACVKESMRITPVTIGSMRTVQEDLVLCGYRVPAGTKIFIQSYVMGVMEKYFPEPQQFRPDRFLREEASHDPFAFLPFGFGPRSCIGRRIAEQEIWVLLIRILQRFRIEYHHEDIDMLNRGLAVPDKPLRFQFYDR